MSKNPVFGRCVRKSEVARVERAVLEAAFDPVINVFIHIGTAHVEKAEGEGYCIYSQAPEKRSQL
jgi:hypothetical protein